AEFTVEAFQVIGQDVESTKLEVVKTPGTITPPVIPPTSPDQFKCDIDWWTLRSFFLCMTGDGLYIPENNLDPSDPNWPKKRRPVPRFDCDDFSDAMIQWLLRRLEAIYGPGSVTAENLIFAWQCPDNSTTPPGWHKPIGHAMPLIQKDGKFYLIDPFTGKAYGPFNTREEAYKKALELFMRCEGGRPVGNPDYWVPGYRPGWEPKPWWTDWEMQKHFCERLKACCGSSLVPPGENLPTCPPSTTPGGVAPTVLTPCNFRDYMPPGTFVDPRANCDH
ncbi:MAG: hypothetical protein Q8N51_07925, partial [Gammaproteobacteria bacterium]|nr:hypothetical protein [Gammaproteobacteria bacterium]